ncbi:carboxypeptidase-like regulatory domain-containing protein [Granulicella sp. 5B5]|uniref:carboxypeptidase-like regulatory domain-containing protein n=1 Tax=Granulicella sp. 5B5 TaxID=1617967 RepID=UPI0015F720BE|nr:carboxypeptidase-like regulatory domain-containing protein [Granulicella sp. 5B5]
MPDAPSPAAQGQGRAMVSGVVKDVGGTPVGGAHVVLDGPAGMTRTAVTDEDGEYEFEGLVAGRYSVSVKAEGLADGRVVVMVPSSGDVKAPEFSLKLVTVNAEVEAVSPKELAEMQVKQEEKQRILGVIPNFYVAYDPNTVGMTQGQKLQLAGRTLIDPVTFAAAAVGAGLNQATQTPSQWGQDWAGFGQRYGAQMAGTLAGVGLSGYVFPAIFHQDPRYFYKADGTVKERTEWALKQVLEQRSDKGKWQPGWSNMLGDLAASTATVALYPHDDVHWGSTTAANFGLNLAGTAFGNIMEEFVVPKLVLHRKKAKQTTP